MFNLPWYAWLNLLALPVLWVLFYVEYVVTEKPRWLRQYSGVAMAAAAVVILLYWNPHINTALVPLQYGLMLLVVPFAVVQLGVAITGLILSLLAWCIRFTRGSQIEPAEPESGAIDDLEADSIDLDKVYSGTDCSADKVGRAVSTLFSRHSSLESNIDSLVTLSRIDRNTDSKVDDVAAHLIQGALIAALLLPPLVMCIRLV